MRYHRFKRTVKGLALMISVLALSACRLDSDIGGPLPTLVTEWSETDTPDNTTRRLTTPAPTAVSDEAPFNVVPDPSGIGDNVPVSRAMVAKMLALTYFDMNEINTLDREIVFNDVDTDTWYNRYVNAVCVRGFMAGAGEVFLPDAPLTLGQAHDLLLSLDPLHKPGIVLSEANRDKPVSYALWVELYKKLLEGAADGRSINEAFGIEGANVVVLATSGNNINLSEGQMVADIGAFSHAGLNLDAYIDKEIRVFYKDREIIALIALVSETPTVSNVYITDADNEGLSIFCGGVQRYYAYGPGCIAVSAAQIGGIGDVRLENGKVLSVVTANETVTGTILRTTAQFVELKEWGVLPLDTKFKTYSTAGGAVKWKSFNQLLVGTNMATFYKKDGLLCAGVITQNVTPSTIRVAIGTSGYAGLVHQSVTVTSAGSFTVTGDGVNKKYEAGRRFTVSDIENPDLLGVSRLFIQPDEPGGTLQITGLKRNWAEGANPRYRGVIEIAREDNGFTIINELPLEEYLYAVVPSEMPSSYGVEVSKVQAVTARSYAYTQFFENRFHAYGAHVDDSVSCQVYNNIPENKTSIEAVDATRGQCLTYNGAVIAANFFSTSCGMTANSGEVWASGGRFPASTGAYLKARPQYDNATYGDLSDEKNAASFFKDTALEAYDSSFSWFRWQVRMTVEEIAASVNAHLYERYKAAPSLIKTLQTDDPPVYRSRPVEHIGSLVGLQVLKRGQGGNIMELLITGTEATVLVSTEYNIRMLIRPMRHDDNGRDIELTRADGSTVVNYSLMPSAFFSFDLETDEEGRLTGVYFYGGGNGHGVGMSQNGVKGMIDRGFSFADTLEHYYPSTKIKQIY